MTVAHMSPPPAMVAPVRPGRHDPFQTQGVDADTATLTAQAYLRRIHWTRVASPLNTPLVAVLDTGVTPAAAGLAGRVDTAGARSFAPGGGDAQVDAEGHGTHVAGIIATVASGTLARPGVRILPVQVAGSTGETSAQAVAAGIRYAVSHRARVINLSLQGQGFSRAEQDAINDATRARVLVVAASGNTGTDAREYPGAYRHVLAVGAVGPDGVALTDSTRGLQVAVAAPGQDILSSGASGPAGGPRFDTRSGTSMAAAVVTGMATRILAARPKLTPSQVTEIIMASARGTPGGVDRARGTGIVDLGRALRTPVPADDAPEPDDDAPSARLLPALLAAGQTSGERSGRLRTWADLRDEAVVHLEAGQVLDAEASVSGQADVDLYLWRPGAPIYRQGAIFARRWLAAGAVARGPHETLTYRAPQAGDYVLEVRLAGAVRLIRPTYSLTASVVG